MEKFESDVGAPEEAAIRSRRSLFASVVGVAGLAALSACRETDWVEGSSGALSYGSDDVVDTIAALRTLAPGVANRGVTVLGIFDKRDGGGGLFLYDTGSTATDDGSSVVRPNSVAAGSPGRFHRHIGGRVVTPRMFLAPGVDDAAAFNAAFAYLVSRDGGGTLLVDETYFLTSPVVIPHHSSRPIRILGLGRAFCGVRGIGLPVGVPMFSFGAPIGPYGIYDGFRLESLGMTRDTHGPCFEYYYAGLPGSEAANRRLEYPIFRDVWFQSTSAASGNTYPNVRIQFGGNGVFEDLTFAGGQTAMQVLTTTRCTFRNIRYAWDNTCTYGFHFVRSGGLLLQNVRVEATSGGFGVKFEDCAGMVVDSLTFEGKRTSPQIWLENSQNFRFRDASTSSRTQLGSNTEYRAGVRIDGTSSHIQFQGGTLFPKESDSHSNSFSLDIGASCRAIAFDRVAIARFDGNDSLVATELNVHPSAFDVSLDLVFVNFPSGAPVAQNRYIVKSALPVVTATSTLSARNSDAIRVSGTTPITALTNGYPGQRLVLIFLSAGAQVQSSASIKLASTFTASAANATLELIHDGSMFLEIARRV